MNTGDLPNLLLYRLPEIAPAIEEELNSWRDAVGGTEPSVDYVFAAILAPLTAQLMRRGDGDAGKTVAKIFDFLEELLRDDNESVRNVVDVSFAEQFVEERDALEKAWPLLGPRLRHSIDQLLSPGDAFAESDS